MSQHTCDLPDAGGFGDPEEWVCPGCGARYEREYEESWDEESGDELCYFWWVLAAPGRPTTGEAR